MLIKLLIFSLLLPFSNSFASWQRGNVLEHGINPERFDKFIDFVFEQSDVKRTNSLVIIHKGKLIFEQYARGFHQDSKFRLWSISKTVAGLILLKAIDEKILQLPEPIAAFYPSVKNEMAAIRVKDLMQMSSGIKFNEDYSNPLISSTLSMLYGEGNQDMAQYVLNLSAHKKPGSYFSYSSGDSNLLMSLLKQRLGKQEYEDYPWKKLFEPMGIKDVTFERDSSGTFMSSSYLYMQAQDMAKIGQLILRRGNWQGQQLISGESFNEMIQLAPALKTTMRDPKKEDESYGLQIWLNQVFESEVTNKTLGPYIKGVPDSLIIARGYAGQAIYIFPHKNLVVVRTAHDIGRQMDWQKFATLILDSFEEIQ